MTTNIKYDYYQILITTMTYNDSDFCSMSIVLW